MKQPDWDWYDNTDLKVGVAQSQIHTFLLDDEYEKHLKDLKEQEKRRIKPGFHVKDSKRRVQHRRVPKEGDS